MPFTLMCTVLFATSALATFTPPPDEVVIDLDKFDRATVVIEVDAVEPELDGSKYRFEWVTAGRILKNESSFTFDEPKRVAHYGWMTGAVGQRIVYLEPYNSPDNDIWRLLGGGVEKADFILTDEERAPRQAPPRPSPLVWRDPDGGTLVIVESDRRHLLALDAAGRLLWTADPLAEADFVPFHQDAVVDSIETATDTPAFEHAVSIRVGTDFGVIDLETGRFFWLGRD